MFWRFSNEAKRGCILLLGNCLHFLGTVGKRMQFAYRRTGARRVCRSTMARQNLSCSITEGSCRIYPTTTCLGSNLFGQYSEVTLDSYLIWSVHLVAGNRRIQLSLSGMQGLVLSKIRTLQPTVMHWLYRTAVRPSIHYRVLVSDKL